MDSASFLHIRCNGMEVAFPKFGVDARCICFFDIHQNWFIRIYFCDELFIAESFSFQTATDIILEIDSDKSILININEADALGLNNKSGIECVHLQIGISTYV